MRSSKIKEYLALDSYHFRDNKTVRCVAKNAVYSEMSSQLIAKLDRTNIGADMHVSLSERISANAHLVSLECAAYHKLYADQITWLKDGKIVESSDGKSYHDIKVS